MRSYGQQLTGENAGREEQLLFHNNKQYRIENCCFCRTTLSLLWVFLCLLVALDTIQLFRLIEYSLYSLYSLYIIPHFHKGSNIIAACVHGEHWTKLQEQALHAAPFAFLLRSVWSRFRAEIWNCGLSTVIETLLSWDFSPKEEKTKRDWKQKTFQIFFLHKKIMNQWHDWEGGVWCCEGCPLRTYESVMS